MIGECWGGPWDGQISMFDRPTLLTPPKHEGEYRWLAYCQLWMWVDEQGVE